VLPVHEPAVQIDLLAHTPLLSLDRVPKYSTAPGVLQHAPPACTPLPLFQPIHPSNAQSRRALWHVLPLHSASRFRPGRLVRSIVPKALISSTSLSSGGASAGTPRVLREQAPFLQLAQRGFDRTGGFGEGS